MSVRFLSSSGSQFPPTHHLFSSSSLQTLTLTLKLTMGSQTPQKRPFCPRCSKPARVCLCSRLKSPPLQNPIPITILQHSLEKDHPLNSIRVARLGLKNLTVVPVTDVNFHAHFTIHPDSAKRPDFSMACVPGDEEGVEDLKRVGLEAKSSDFAVRKTDLSMTHFTDDADGEFGDEKGVKSVEKMRLGMSLVSGKPRSGKSLDFVAASDGNSDNLDKRLDFECTDEYPSVGDGLFGLEKPNSEKSSDFDYIVGNGEGEYGCRLSHLKNHRWETPKKLKLDLDNTQDSHVAIFDKYQVACSSTDLQIRVERAANPNISWVLDTPIGRAASSKGFVVKRLQRKQLHGSEEFHDFEEFEIAMPAGAALLFPSGKAAISLGKVDFKVTHLVVLDGTWKKARRIYCENPWLQLLPHLKLDSGKESLYSEVRHEPKAGCLSTIESIVYALKGLGSDMEGLNELLDVFGSMIGDQRRLKDERSQAKLMS